MNNTSPYITRKAKEAVNEVNSYIKEFITHIKEDFHPGYYLTVAIFLAVTIYINYTWFGKSTFERTYLYTAFGRDTGFFGFGKGTGILGKEACIIYYFLFYAFPYFFILTAHAFFKNKWEIFASRAFWLRSFVGLFILSFDAAFYYYRLLKPEDLAAAGMNVYDWYWVKKCTATLGSVIAICIPLLLFRYWRDIKSQSSLYGLTFKGFDWKPYVILLLIMFPLVLGASFTKHFTDYYPTLKLFAMDKVTIIPKWAGIGIYETLYAADFIWTELIFRGFMVVGMIAVLGRAAVLPMAGIYAFRHFAKPAGETISSIFGGFILGVIALKSRNIMGGVFIHMGIALMMDIFAIMQTYLFK